MSRWGTIAGCWLRLDDEEPIAVLSVYAPFDRVRPTRQRPWIVADSSAMRLAADISYLITTQRKHRVIVAGDLNTLRDWTVPTYGPYWRRRDDAVWAYLHAIGLRLAGPQHPHGHQAESWPSGLDEGSRNVPTWSGSRGDRQLDWVLCSEGLLDRLTVTALNSPDEWGPSDHCRILIDIEP